MSTTSTETYTVAELATVLGVSRWTVQRMIAADAVRSIRIGRAFRIPRSERARILALREVPTRRPSEAA